MNEIKTLDELEKFIENEAGEIMIKGGEYDGMIVRDEDPIEINLLKTIKRIQENQVTIQDIKEYFGKSYNSKRIIYDNRSIFSVHCNGEEERTTWIRLKKEIKGQENNPYYTQIKDFAEATELHLKGKLYDDTKSKVLYTSTERMLEDFRKGELYKKEEQ